MSLGWSSARHRDKSVPAGSKYEKKQRNDPKLSTWLLWKEESKGALQSSSRCRLHPSQLMQAVLGFSIPV